MPRPDVPKITRTDVDCWLCQIERDLKSALKGPPGELKARLALVLNRIESWRDDLGVRRTT